MRAAIIALAVAATACSQPATTTEPAATNNDELVLSCAAFASLTPETLAARFGVENLTTQTLPGAEGESYEATVVFPDDASRRLEIVWNDARTAPVSVSVESVDSAWRGHEGYVIGTPIADIERINVMPFELWGFGWDYGGWVSDWRAGALSQTPGCNVRLRFTPRNETTGAMGDSPFMSNDPAVREADPIVSEMALMFAAQ